jgi:3'-phosphoadenosine 5'-phosphosulfate (PAPS) 3'-phosphatase
VVRAGGAGHKLLMVGPHRLHTPSHPHQVSLGLADLYLNSGPSTFQWDTCGPAALLLATGGGLLDCAESRPILYSVAGAPAHGQGILAHGPRHREAGLSLLAACVRGE